MTENDMKIRGHARTAFSPLSQRYYLACAAISSITRDRRRQGAAHPFDHDESRAGNRARGVLSPDK
jgi:hypothetical protein